MGRWSKEKSKGRIISSWRYTQANFLTVQSRRSKSQRIVGHLTFAALIHVISSFTAFNSIERCKISFVLDRWKFPRGVLFQKILSLAFWSRKIKYFMQPGNWPGHRVRKILFISPISRQCFSVLMINLQKLWEYSTTRSSRGSSEFIHSPGTRFRFACVWSYTDVLLTVRCNLSASISPSTRNIFSQDLCPFWKRLNLNWSQTDWIIRW